MNIKEGTFIDLLKKKRNIDNPSGTIKNKDNKENKKIEKIEKKENQEEQNNKLSEINLPLQEPINEDTCLNY